MTTKAAPRSLSGAGRDWWIQMAWLLAAVGIVCLDLSAWWNATRIGFAVPPNPGMDFDTYTGAAERWLAGGSFYHPWQLAGPYEVWFQLDDPILYPPTILPLLAAFTVLPSFLYWAIPVAVIVGCVAYLRPHPLGLLVVAGLVAWPNSLAWLVWFGNPTIWVVAALSLACAGQRWAAPWVLLKPSVFPFALWGIRSRRWWAGLAAFGLVSLAFLPMWADYLTVLLNTRSVGLLYSVWNVVALAVPIAAWLARSGSSRRPRSGAWRSYCRLGC